MSAEDKVKNPVQKVTGNVKEGTGKMTGDMSLEAEGHRDQAAGNLKQAGEKVKDAVKK